MKKKMVVSTLALVSFALAGCGNNGEESVDTTSNTEVSSSSTHKDPNDVINSIKDDIENKEGRPSVQLGMNSGVVWKDGGYKAALTDGKADLAGDTSSDKLFVVKDGEVVEEIPLEEGSFTYTAEAADGDVLTLVADDRLEVGETDVDMAEVDRAEEITFVAE